METLKDPQKEVEPVAKAEPEEKVAPEAISQAADPLQYKTAEEFVKGQRIDHKIVEGKLGGEDIDKS